MNVEPVRETTGAVIRLTAAEARELYASLYHMSSELGVPSPASRGKVPWAGPLFDLYDQLYQGGFDT